MRANDINKIMTMIVICSIAVLLGCRREAAKTQAPAVSEPVKKAEPAKPVEPAKPAEAAKEEVKPAKTTEKKPAPTVAIALKFNAGDSTNYRVTTEAQDSVKFEGKMPGKLDEKDKSNIAWTEITFNESIKSVGADGNAVAQITVTGVKYKSTYKNELVMDFNSFKGNDPGNPMSKLIGQSYTININPNGRVTKIDAAAIKGALHGSTAMHRTALSLLEPNAIKDRHGQIIFPAKDKDRLGRDQHWSDIKTFTFRMMGGSAFERVFTLKEITDANNTRTASIAMEAIPSAAKAAELQKDIPENDFAKRFDNTQTYKGSLNFDPNSGKIRKYSETLQSEWVIVDQSALDSTEGNPATLKMGAIRKYSLKKLN